MVRKILWLVMSSLILLSLVIAACGPTEVVEEEKPVIKMADNMFESGWINNAIAEFIIEKGYGYPVEQVVVTTPVLQVSLAKGDLHIMMEMWYQNYIDWWNKEIAAGNIEELGMIYEGGPQFFAIPEWMHEKHNINTVEDMKDHWELVKDPEDPTKGAFFNCIIGWQCAAINEVKLEAYGLTEYYNIMSPGSAGALEAALAGPQKTGKPVFGYYWAPTALMGMYDWYILEEPEYDADVWDKIIAAKDNPSLRPLSEACAYETLPPLIGVHKSLRDIAPDVVTMLEKMMVGLEAINKTAAWAKENDIQEWDKAGIYFMKNYEDRWKTWVTDDAYSKIKDALAEL